MRANGFGIGRWSSLGLLMVAGCFTGANIGVTSSSSAGSSAGSPTGSAATGGESTGTASGGNGSSSSGGSSTSSGGRIGTTGGSLPPLIDGGYVFCNVASADGGPASWLCEPGTYFCDVNGNLGTCYQCLSDADCTNQVFPTYDPRRPYCDLGSGLAGRQNFCQECTSDSDCDGNPAGPFCDLNANYPPDSLQPPIVTVGFETCGKLQTDCRLDSGPRCDMLNEVCDPTRGSCVYLNVYSCSSDQDCIGALTPPQPDFPTQPNLPAPFCVEHQCTACDGSFCPGSPCFSDLSCGNPTASDAGLLCGVSLQDDDYDCLCTSSAQCGSFWPACIGIGNGTVNPLGEPAGICGCDRDDECGDGGLVCLTPNETGYMYNAETNRSFCGLPCTSPRFPACASATDWSNPICLPSTRLCEPCAASDQCRGEVDTGGDICLSSGNRQGTCGCLADTDCPVGQSCSLAGICQILLPQCVRDSCGGQACNWDSGACGPYPGCRLDSDCDWPSPFCDRDSGSCIDCHDDADCVTIGVAAEFGASQCLSSGCSNLCTVNCFGNAQGSACLDGGLECGCNSDQDCVGSAFGQHCSGDPDSGLQGICGCQTTLDCDAGTSCNVFGQCSSSCESDAECPVGYFCAPSSQCQPRCDNGNTCQGFDSICDTNDIHGENGTVVGGLAAPGVIWCYACLSSRDCPNGLGCPSGLTCAACDADFQCDPSQVCNLYDGTCHDRCDAGVCPNGEICDTLGTAGYGANFCFACVTARDCPDGFGCNSRTHVCGSCEGGDFSGPDTHGFDCPPDAVCSNFWAANERNGVCLANCDLRSCPPSEPICAVLPRLTTDHKFCFGCLQDSDCADAGAGAWCDVSVSYTFQCQPGSG